MSMLSLPNHLKIDFFKGRWVAVGLFFLVLMSVFLGLWMGGLKKGIDFQGGSSIEFSYSQGTLDHLRHNLQPLVHGSFTLQEFGGKGSILLRCELQKEDLAKKIQDYFKGDVVIKKVESIGPKIGAELMRSSIYAMILSLLAMLIYVAFRFQWIFGVSSILSLIFDCSAIVLFYLVTQMDFNEGAIVALLITAAYSINDTVIVFDRIRENRRQNSSKVSIADLINRSVNETLPRTLLTSASTLTALIVLYCFGGPVIQEFVLPIFVGFTVGTYSSIVLAAPLLGLFLLHKEQSFNKS
jgi:preprotein translocase subunit SecF